MCTLCKAAGSTSVVLVVAPHTALHILRQSITTGLRGHTTVGESTASILYWLHNHHHTYAGTGYYLVCIQGKEWCVRVFPAFVPTASSFLLCGQRLSFHALSRLPEFDRAGITGYISVSTRSYAIAVSYRSGQKLLLANYGLCNETKQIYANRPYDLMASALNHLFFWEGAVRVCSLFVIGKPSILQELRKRLYLDLRKVTTQYQDTNEDVKGGLRTMMSVLNTRGVDTSDWGDCVF
jgi:hypothetical protein